MDFDNPIIRFTLFAAGALLLWGVVRYVLATFARSTSSDLDDVTAKLLEAPIIPAGIAVAIWQTAISPDWWAPISGRFGFLIRGLIVAAVVLTLWRLIGRVVREAAQVRSETTKSKVDDVIAPILSRQVLPAVLVLGSIMSLFWVFGGSIAAGIATAGGLSFLLVYLLQEPLSNLFGGLSLALDTPFVYGDLVTLEDGKTYAVQEIGARVTRLYDINEHNHVYVPNVSLTSQNLINLVRPNSELRQQLSVGVAYDTDLGEAKSLLEVVAERHPHVLSAPSSDVRQFMMTEVSDGPLHVLRIDHEHQVRNAAELLLRDVEIATRRISSLEEFGISEHEEPEARALIDGIRADYSNLRSHIGSWFFIRAFMQLTYARRNANELPLPDPEVIENLAGQFAIGFGYERDGELGDWPMGSHIASIEVQHASLAFSGLVQDLVKSLGMEVASVAGTTSWLDQFEDWDTYAQFENFYRGFHKPMFDIDRSITTLEQALRPGRSRHAVRLHKLLDEVAHSVATSFPLGLNVRRYPTAGVSELADSAVVLTLDFYIDDISDDYFERRGDVTSEILEAIVSEFNEHRIEMPFPQVDVVGLAHEGD